MNTQRNFGRNVAANLLARTWAGVLWFALVPAYLAFLGPEAYGLVGLYLSLSMIVQLLDLGLSPTMTRELSRASGLASRLAALKDLTATAEAVTWATALIIATSLWSVFTLTASGWLRPDSLPQEQVTLAMGLAGLAVAAQWPVLLYSGTLAGLNRQTWTAAAGAIFATLRGVGSVLILWKVSPTPAAFFLWNATCSIAHSLTLALALRRAAPPELRGGRPKLAAIAQVSRFAGGMSILAVLAIIVTQVDKLLLSAWLPLDKYGYYMAAAAVATIPQFIVSPISAALLPELSHALAHGPTPGAIALYRRTSRWLAVALAAPTALALTFGDEILAAWSGNARLAEEVGLALALLMAGAFLNGLMCVPYTWQIARGWPQIPIRINLASLCAMLPALWFGASEFGPPGAAFAWLTFNLAYVAANLYSMTNNAPETHPLEGLLQDVLRPILAAVLVCALATALPVPESRQALGAMLCGILVLGATAAFIATPQCLKEVLAWRNTRPISQ
ncbi:oligosaccharide flippase family protein [Aromatoleum toluolicum]|uniref:Oligosaccharide flippase family protein n=1 Tax=Aromatoleum toluolicum TaxID=90060 RepID=A0ABX1NKM5_9RHOO|nr:oligosaccharide flippase family protein [Aromatoleum toluolicum]NMF99887.1 oligosaccharide flippase family protein [Aromatoleum toluolicum]